MEQQKGQLPGPFGIRIATDGNMLNGIQTNARFPQAELDCLRWKPSPMLHPPEPLFLGGGD
jgi:hypothetical protein